MSQKFLDLAGLTAYDRMLKEWFKAGVVDIADESIQALFVIPATGPADNEIWYTSVDGNVVTPASISGFGANIVSNTYENGKGIITFDGVMTSIGDYAFHYCNLTSITIPNSVTSIRLRAFNNCSHLTSITIPNSVTSIRDAAFQGCTDLISVTIGNSVTSIVNTVFSGCSKLTSVTINSDAFVSKDYSYNSSISHIFGSQVTEYIIGDNVTSIGKYAFYGCSKLTSVTIPNSVASIGNSAFSGCSSLTSVTIPNSVASIGNYVFSGCSGLTSVTIPNSVTSIGDGTFNNCSALTSITFGGTKEEWNITMKGTNWNDNVPATYIQCSDGQVAL